MQHSNTGSPNNLPAALESLSRVSARPLSHPLAVPPFDLGLRLISEIDIRDRREALPGVLPGDTAVASCAVQMVDPKICLLIFVSGKVVLTGAPRVAAFPLHANSHSCTPLSRCSLRTHAHCAHRVHCCGGGGGSRLTWRGCCPPEQVPRTAERSRRRSVRSTRCWCSSKRCATKEMTQRGGVARAGHLFSAAQFKKGERARALCKARTGSPPRQTWRPPAAAAR